MNIIDVQWIPTDQSEDRQDVSEYADELMRERHDMTVDQLAAELGTEQNRLDAMIAHRWIVYPGTMNDFHVFGADEHGNRRYGKGETPRAALDAAIAAVATGRV